MWEALLKFSPPVVQAISIAITAVFAVIGLRAWRRQLIGRRKIEVAEGTLLATYKIRDTMAYIRGPGLVGSSTRPREPDEPERVASLRDSYFVPLERMQKASGDFAEFEKMQFLCQVYFGPKAGEPFARVKIARHRVWVAATMLIRTAGEHGVDRKLLEKWQRQIWEGLPEPESEELTSEVNQAVQEIEAMCRPHLKL